MTTVLTREQAYELVWSAPLTTLAAELGISNVALGKALRGTGLPMPGVGYWAKLAAGKKVKRPVLEAPHLGTQLRIWIPGKPTSAFFARIAGKPGEGDDQQDIEVLTERFKSKLPSLGIPKSHKEWVHPGIQKYLQKDERTRAKAKAEDPIFARFYRPVFEGKDDQRRLQFANNLGFAAQRAGGSLSLEGEKINRVSFRLGSGHSSFDLSTEHNGHLLLTNNKKGSYAKPPALPLRWTDDASGKIESKIKDIIVGMAKSAILEERRWQEEIKALRIREEQRVAEVKRQYEIGQERQRREEAEQRRKEAVASLLKAATGAHESDMIRTYVERSRDALATRIPRERVEAWAVWALKLADELDPWLNGDAEKSVQQHVEDSEK